MYDLEGDAEWDVANLTGSLNLGIQASTHGDYGPLRAAGSAVGKSIPLSVVDLLSLVTCNVEPMSSASIRYVSICVLESPLSSNNT